jgi:nucleoside phosphorylase/CheY-like chemotaxis protein
MIRTIIVEDEAEKRIRISRVLAGVDGFDADQIEYSNDVHSAKKLLHQGGFDLLILDIALPLRGDADVSPHAGLALLEEIVARPGRYGPPDHIIGITAYADIYARASTAFTSRLLTLVQYDPSSSEWELALKARVRHILDAKAAQGRLPPAPESDLAVVCALYSPELTSILALPWDWEQISMPFDHTIYWKGVYRQNNQRKTVYAAHASRMGMPAAAVLTTKMISAFRPRVVAMAGITGGVRGKVNLGDAIVPDPCWDWGSGKWVNASGDELFQPAPYQLTLDVRLREDLRRLSRDAEILAAIRASWMGEKPDSALALHLGPVASGASVLADGTTLDKISQQHRQLLGVEMEAYGALAAAEESTEPRPLAFAIKSVVDFADGEKNDRFQAYGAFTSAQLLRHFAERNL